MTHSDYLAAYDAICEAENALDRLTLIVDARSTAVVSLSALETLYRTTGAMRRAAWDAAHDTSKWES